MGIFLFSWVIGSTKGAVAFEHAAISNMILSRLSTRNIEELAVLIEPFSNPSTLISMLRSTKMTVGESSYTENLDVKDDIVLVEQLNIVLIF